jgi:hypothetical protein
MTMGNTSFENKGLTIADKTKNPLKKAHRLSDKTFVVIDESLVQRLAIDENNTWFEQQSTEGGILLKIIRNDPILPSRNCV